MVTSFVCLLTKAFLLALLSSAYCYSGDYKIKCVEMETHRLFVFTSVFLFERSLIFKKNNSAAANFNIGSTENNLLKTICSTATASDA